MSEPKAFTGRGGAGNGADAPTAEERRLLAALDRVHRAQRQLVEQTKQVVGRRFYLALHKRDSGARFVRWRDTGCEGSNVPWYEVPAFIAREPASLHDWYRRINAHALMLNDEEQLRRMELTLYARRQARLRGDDSLEPPGARRRGGGEEAAMLATCAETGTGSADRAVGPALRYHGGKWRLAPWIVSHFPEHRTYVEPFGGAAGVLLRKSRSYAEVYNDLDDDIANFFRVLRDPALCRALVRAVALTPYARDEFDGAWLPTEDPVERARRTAVRAQMGFGSAGATKGSTGFRIDSKRTPATAQHLWAEYPSAIAAAGLRLAGVLIENRPALEVMRQHDGPDTLHFVDPPYLHQTRTLRGRGYRHEMDDAEHMRLLEALLDLKGMVVLCGYGSALYDDLLRGWTTRRTRARISAARGSAVRTEVLWLNPACEAALAGEGLPLFSGVVS